MKECRDKGYKKFMDKVDTLLEDVHNAMVNFPFSTFMRAFPGNKNKQKVGWAWNSLMLFFAAGLLPGRYFPYATEQVRNFYTFQHAVLECFDELQRKHQRKQESTAETPKRGGGRKGTRGRGTSKRKKNNGDDDSSESGQRDKGKRNKNNGDDDDSSESGQRDKGKRNKNNGDDDDSSESGQRDDKGKGKPKTDNGDVDSAESDSENDGA